jgi:hypothetical protein
MTREQFDPLDLDLRRMLRDLGDGPAAPQEARARLRSALLLGGPLPPGGTPAGDPALTSGTVPGPLPHAAIGARVVKTAAHAGWKLAAGGVGVAGLVGAWLTLGPRGPALGDRSAVRALPETIAASPRVDPAPVVVPPAAERGNESPTVAPASAPSASQGAKPEKRAIDTSLAAERRLIDAARAALVAGDSATGLERLARHASQYPRGVLAEERSALMVDALVAAGRYDEAKRRADAFRARYPGSLFAPSVDAALKAIP